MRMQRCLDWYFEKQIEGITGPNIRESHLTQIFERVSETTWKKHAPCESEAQKIATNVIIVKY